METSAANTDRELWREPPGDYYANSIHVTQDGGIGINVAGIVIVKPLVEWHALALETPKTLDWGKTQNPPQSAENPVKTPTID